MNTFGTIKTKIETASVESYSKSTFPSFMQGLKKFVLENKDMSEIYYIYDDLSSNKGMDSDLATDYINESVEYLQILIESNKKRIDMLDSWVSKYTKTNNNNYRDIDNTIYSKSIRNLETVLESKKRIKQSLIKEEKNKEEVKSINLPLSSVFKVATSTYNRQFDSLDESTKNELKPLLSLSIEDLKDEMNILKYDVVTKLNNKIKESNEPSLKSTIMETIKRVEDSKYDVYNLYKLQQLNEGL